MPSALHLVAGLPQFQGRIRRSRGHLRLVHSTRETTGLQPGVREMVGLQPGVISNWVAVNQPLEGVLPFMYTDALNLVTTGMGNLVDSSQSGSSTPWAPALALPWKNPDGSLADQATVIAQWQAVKNGGVNSSVNAGPLTTIRLDADGIQQAVQTTLDSNEALLRSYFPNWDNLPADAQAAIMSMAWAMGAGFPATFVQFTADINAGNFAQAANDSNFQGVGVSQRIAMDKAMLNNAQIVADNGYDPTVLYWPNLPTANAGGWSTGAKVAALFGGIAAGGVAVIAADHFGLLADIERPLARLGL
jgi:GH24 family phage-related lysozyme (muramidase)